MYRFGEDDFSLRQYLDVLRRRRWVLAGTVVVIVGVTMAYTYAQSPTYRATAAVLLQGTVSEDIFDPDPDASRSESAARARVVTEIEVMRSRSVADAVEAELGHRARVTIAQRGDADLATITASSGNRAAAAEDAQTYAETYVTTRRAQLIDNLLAASEQVQQRLAAVQQQVTDLDVALADLDLQIAGAGGGDEREVLQAQRDALAEQTASQRSALQVRQTTYSSQLDQLELSQSITSTGGAQIVSDARVPASPSSPRPLRNGILALSFGAVLGVGLAFLREHFDDTIKSKDDVDRLAPNLPVLGMLPFVEGHKDRSTVVLYAVDSPRSGAAEAYRTMRTSIQFAGLSRSLGTIQVTSPVAGEGKTTTIANLGVVLARAGHRVVMVDCDLRRSRLHEFFGLENRVGFTSVLVGESTLPAAVQRVPGEARLALLAAGPAPPTPSELLSTRSASELLLALRAEADYVLIDSPPVLPVTDALVLSGVVDAVILVVGAKSSTVRGVHRTLELLDQVEAPVIGTAVNFVADSGATGGRYGYGGNEGYYAPSPAAPRGRPRLPRAGRRAKAYAEADAGTGADERASRSARA